MMTPSEILSRLRARPFLSCRIHLADGRHHDITRSDMAIVMRSTLEVGMNPVPDGFVDCFAPRSYGQISRLKILPEPVAY